MARYVPVELEQLVKASLSPITAKVVRHLLDLEQVKRMVRYAPDDTRALVERELEELAVVAQIHFGEATVHSESVASPVASVAPAEQWVSTAEAARILGKTPRTVTSYIEAGKLTAKRKDKKSYLVLRESAEALHLGEQAAA